MTKFENELLEKLLYMKQNELNELAEFDGLKIKKEEVENTAKICADLANSILRIRKESLANMHNLSSPETRLILQYRSRYPDFKTIAV